MFQVFRFAIPRIVDRERGGSTVGNHNGAPGLVLIANADNAHNTCGGASSTVNWPPTWPERDGSILQANIVEASDDVRPEYRNAEIPRHVVDADMPPLCEIRRPRGPRHTQDL